MKCQFFKILTIVLALGSQAILAEQLPNCAKNETFNDCFGSFKFGPDSEWAGDEYIGEWKNDLFHGQGKYIYSSGNVHTGMFFEGNRHGKGTYNNIEKNNSGAMFAAAAPVVPPALPE